MSQIKKLIASPEFHQWVANTVAELGGNAAQYLRGVGGKCALAVVESGAVACQGVNAKKHQSANLDAAHDSSAVSADLSPLKP